MPLELKLLVWTAALIFVQMLVAAIAGTLQLGAAPFLGNRELALQLTRWAGRAQRAHGNMLEYFALFAALVLVAQATGKLNDMTTLGAQLFFWARLAHAVAYVAGIVYLRTAVWIVSVMGLILIFARLV